jgi:transposase-like protein
MSSKRIKKSYDLDYKRRIVDEYVSGASTVQAIAGREGLVAGQIYKWRVQLAEKGREARLGEIQTENPEISLEQARRIRELEEELAATQKKMAQLAVENELLGELVKKTDPSSPYARRSSGFVEIKAALARSKGRAK